MIKELKYFFFVIVVFLFFFLTSKYYFSNENIKKSYRSYKNLDTKISKYDDKLIEIISGNDQIFVFSKN